MRVIIQRVKKASVVINGGAPVTIEAGLLCLFGVGQGDTPEMIDKLAYKTANLRIFEDEAGRMNHSAAELGYEILAVPNFTLYADTKKGLRPSFTGAADPAVASPAFDNFVGQLRAHNGGRVKQGEFGADMQVSLINDGPVTIILDPKEWQA